MFTTASIVMLFSRLTTKGIQSERERCQKLNHRSLTE